MDYEYNATLIMRLASYAKNQHEVISIINEVVEQINEILLEHEIDLLAVDTDIEESEFDDYEDDGFEY